MALNCGLEMPRERLIELFWSDMEPTRAREGLRTTLSTLRRAFRDSGSDPDAIVIADRRFARLNLTVDSDVKELEACVNSDAQSDWWSAVDLYVGDFLDGNYEEWAVAIHVPATALAFASQPLRLGCFVLMRSFRNVPRNQKMKNAPLGAFLRDVLRARLRYGVKL